MSCGYGNNNFNYLGTYNRDTLQFQNYDPYPELKGPFSDYKSCNSVKEAYTQCCNAGPYVTLSSTWNVKMKYST